MYNFIQRRLSCCICLAFLASGNAFGHHEKNDIKFDIQIRQATQRYWPKHSEAYSWQWYKAQLKQESSLNPNAMSPAKAAGLSQFIPSAWLDAQRRRWVPKGSSPFEPRHSIVAGARYMRWLNDQWKSPRPNIDRMNLARASFNAGLGHILSAQKLCNNRNLYGEIIRCLSQVTGDHSKETIDYNIRIAKIRREL